MRQPPHAFKISSAISRSQLRIRDAQEIRRGKLLRLATVSCGVEVFPCTFVADYLRHSLELSHATLCCELIGFRAQSVSRVPKNPGAYHIVF